MRDPFSNIPRAGAATDAIRAAVPNVVAAYVFGSQAAGTARADSDVDVAILAEDALSAEARFDLQARLAHAFRADAVDLVDLRAASTVMQMQVLHSGRVLLDEDRTAREHFEVYVYSAYALLNEERQGILGDIRKRGRVYG